MERDAVHGVVQVEGEGDELVGRLLILHHSSFLLLLRRALEKVVGCLMRDGLHSQEDIAAAYRVGFAQVLGRPLSSELKSTVRIEVLVRVRLGADTDQLRSFNEPFDSSNVTLLVGLAPPGPSLQPPLPPV